MEKKSLLILGFLIVLASMSFVSAGIFDWAKMTGQVTNQPTNVTVTVVGVSPVVVTDVILASATITPLENTNVAVNFEVHVTDPDGFNDINLTETIANATHSTVLTEAVRIGVCTFASQLSSTSANFSCVIQMKYWDLPGEWNLTVGAIDSGNLTYQYKTDVYFTYEELKAVVISPNNLTWPLLNTGAANQESNNDPTIVNNTGNYNRTVSVVGIDLYGNVNSSNSFGVTNFTSSINQPTVCASGTTLSNATDISIASSYANPGNLSLGGGAGQEDLYYCIPLIPNVPSQSYSTQSGGNWLIGYYD